MAMTGPCLFNRSRLFRLSVASISIPRAKASLRLYYGDQKLEAPAYDYGKFFQPDADAAVAQLGPEAANQEFTGRPDERPWSERHTIVLWAAIVIAVALLGGIAIRGFVKEK
jgi:hypothetical protein